MSIYQVKPQENLEKKAILYINKTYYNKEKYAQNTDSGRR